MQLVLDMRLRDIAIIGLVAINEADSIDKAITVMEEADVRHLPVLRDGLPVGIVSDRDILSHVGGLQGKDRVATFGDHDVVGPISVTEIMASPLTTFRPDEKVEHAGRIMLDNSISAAPLVADGTLFGIVTESDFLNCYLETHPDSPDSNWRYSMISERMTAGVKWLSPDDSLETAISLMNQRHIRHVPIVALDRLAGIVSDRDIRQACYRRHVSNMREAELHVGFIHQIVLREIMTDRVDSMASTQTLAEAAHDMCLFKIGSLPIVDGGKLVGIITETDLLRGFIEAFEARHVG